MVTIGNTDFKDDDDLRGSGRPDHVLGIVSRNADVVRHLKHGCVTRVTIQNCDTNNVSCDEQHTQNADVVRHLSHVA